MNHAITNQVAANGISVGFCQSCGFRHQDPLPTVEEVKKYYEDDTFYSSFAPKDWFDKERKEHVAGLWNAYYDYKLDIIEKHLKRKLDMVYIVDVGSGAGWFIKRAQEKSWNAWGIEPSQTARQLLNLYYNIAHVLRNMSSIPVVHLSLVLEHLADPRDELLKWRSKMSSDGLIMVVTPNDFSPLQKELGTYHFISKVHLNYFEPATLRNLMHSCGFRVIHESATFPIELFCLAGFDYRGNDKLGRHCHNARLQLEKVFGTRVFDLYQKLYDRYQWGRELVFLGEKV